jgi:hypothetical protein
MRKIKCINSELALLCLFGLALIGVLSCSDSPTKSEKEQPEVQAVLRQIPGCGGHGLTKAAGGDSCFSYKFTQNLVVDFCVAANCCPDSNRFELAHVIHNDTIFVAVADTAANLCRCICNYVIHAEFAGLSRDQYIFYCQHADAVAYCEPVQRKL